VTKKLNRGNKEVRYRTTDLQDRGSVLKTANDPSLEAFARKKLLKLFRTRRKCKSTQGLRRNVTGVQQKSGFFAICFQLHFFNAIAPSHTENVALGFEPVAYLYIAVYGIPADNGFNVQTFG